jgi:hypothetical protein
LTPMCRMRHTSNLCVRYRKKHDSFLNFVFLCKLYVWVFHIICFVKIEGLVSSWPVFFVYQENTKLGADITETYVLASMNLTLMGLCIRSLFYLETALHVLGGTSTHHQECKQLYLQHLVFVTPLLLPAAAVTVWQIPDVVDTVVCAPDDGWWYHPKHVEQFPDKINCVTLHLVGYILEYVLVLSVLISCIVTKFLIYKATICTCIIHT